MPKYILSNEARDAVLSALEIASNLIGTLENPKHEDTVAKLEAAYELVEDAPKAPPQIVLSVRDAYILRESLSDVRAWADGRKTTAPVGLGHDLDQLDQVVQALTASPGLTPWDNERAKYWGARRG